LRGSSVGKGGLSFGEKSAHPWKGKLLRVQGKKKTGRPDVLARHEGSAARSGEELTRTEGENKNENPIIGGGKMGE